MITKLKEEKLSFCSKENQNKIVYDVIRTCDQKKIGFISYNKALKEYLFNSFKNVFLDSECLDDLAGFLEMLNDIENKENN